MSTDTLTARCVCSAAKEKLFFICKIIQVYPFPGEAVYKRCVWCSSESIEQIYTLFLLGKAKEIGDHSGVAMKTALILLFCATVAWSYPNFISPFNTGQENQVWHLWWCHTYRCSFSFCLQELYPQHDDAAASSVTHTDIEIIAQAYCSAIGTPRGMTYAVQRVCGTASPQTCTDICTSKKLHDQDPQTKNNVWYAGAAVHVYPNRPSSAGGTVADPILGLKVLSFSDVNSPGCGPNFCCCTVTP